MLNFHPSIIPSTDIRNPASAGKTALVKVLTLTLLASLASACTINIVDMEGRDSEVNQGKLTAKRMLSDKAWLEANARHNEADIAQSLAEGDTIASETGFFLGPRDVSYDIKLEGINALFGYDYYTYGRTNFGVLAGLEYNQADIRVSDQSRDYTVEERLYLFALGLNYDTRITDQWVHRLRLTSSSLIGDANDRVLRGEFSFLYQPVDAIELEAGWHWTDYEVDSQFLSDIDFRLSGPMLGATFNF